MVITWKVFKCSGNLVSLSLKLVKPFVLVVKSFRKGINLRLVRLFGG